MPTENGFIFIGEEVSEKVAGRLDSLVSPNSLRGSGPGGVLTGGGLTELV